MQILAISDNTLPLQDPGGQTSGDVRNGTDRVDGELGCLDGQQRDTYITNVSRTDREGPPDTSIAIPSSGSFDKQSCICNRKGRGVESIR